MSWYCSKTDKTIQNDKRRHHFQIRVADILLLTPISVLNVNKLSQHKAERFLAEHQIGAFLKFSNQHENDGNQTFTHIWDFPGD